MYRLEPLRQSLNPIIESFNEYGIDANDIELIVPAIPAIIKMLQNAKLDNKLGLLTGEFRGKENDVYIREECLIDLQEYFKTLPEKLEQARAKKIIKEAQNEISKDS